ncbi:dihydrodipicolinate synthase family protein [Petroclostridium sp. X23]|uniref:dihydrodipicolinate synthase family protein n=1 Tax=Petroclostridium sp. X23 TaxID=3045146 RepID=UPI0024ADD81B|nr:dihydrodipicolinate synthase family protein [Petroclostridium sp. X23]WHH61019.1 dihydrodipicolinate synthase family protein [Petroclostridium sp. X23]
MDIKKHLTGVIPAVATPLTHAGDIDVAAYKKLIRRLIEAGCDGVMILGTAGEGTVLDRKKYTLAVQTVVEEVNGTHPVIVGVGACTLEDIFCNIESAYKIGADAVLSVPPFYYPLPQASIEDFFKILAKKSKLPVMVYNIPALTKNNVSIDTIRRLSQEENIIGIKDSSGDFIYFQQLIKYAQSDKFKVFMGRAPLILPAMLLGADGSMTPIPNVIPELELDIHRKVKAADMNGAQQSQNKVMEIVKLFGYTGNPVSMNLKGLMSALDICEKYTAETIPVLPEEKVKEFGSIFHEIIE